MSLYRKSLAWLVALSLALAIMHPGNVFANGDDDWDDDDVPVYVDDDDWDDDDWDDDDWDDDDWDDDDWDDDDWDDDDWDDDDWDDDDWDDDDWDDDDWDDDDWDDDDVIYVPGSFEVEEGDDDGTDRAIVSQALVQLAPGVNPYAWVGKYNAQVFRILPGPNIVLIGITEGEDENEVVDAMQNDDDLLWGERHYTSQAPEGRPYYFFTSMDESTGAVDAPALPAGLEFTPAETCATGDSVIVAVLDTGVDVTHPDLAANILPNGVNMFNATYDLSDAGNGIDDDGDGHIDEMAGHGTHVIGTILQVAPDAQILPVKVLNDDGVGDIFSVVAGIHYAIEQDADIINLSLGTTFESNAIQQAISHAEEQGVIVVAAAGNSNRSVPLEYPASITPVISVGATTNDADKADYSNYNEAVDISAPGNNIASTYPGGQYTIASGTSMSAPIVTGSIALMIERSPGMDPATATSQVQASASPLNLSDPAFDGQLGAGEIDVDGVLACDG